MYYGIGQIKTVYTSDPKQGRSCSWAQADANKAPSVPVRLSSALSAASNGQNTPPPFWSRKSLITSVLQRLQGYLQEALQRIRPIRLQLLVEDCGADIHPYPHRPPEWLPISALHTSYLRVSPLDTVKPYDLIVSSLHTLYYQVSPLHTIKSPDFIVSSLHTLYYQVSPLYSIKSHDLIVSSLRACRLALGRHHRREPIRSRQSSLFTYLKQ